MQQAELIEYLRNRPSPFVKFGIVDIDGIPRGKLIHRDKLLASLDKGLGFCDVVFGWDSADSTYDNSQLTGRHTGYPDLPARIDWGTLRRIPWEDDLPFFLADFHDHDFPACPRSLLRRVIAQAEEMGFDTLFALEYEWFNFRETPQSWSSKGYRRPEPLTPGMFGYSALRFHQEHEYVSAIAEGLADFDVPLEGFHTETGPGVYEAAIAATDALAAADRAVCAKTGIKALAHSFGYLASFMAKWHDELPGCGGHIHQSLWRDGTNAFVEESARDGMSATMRHYLAGQLHCLPYILPFFAPTINSYKRLTEGAWAPTTLTWGYDNRTVALRVLTPSPEGTRLETRPPGADANPYLAIAAALAGGLYGIRHQLEPQQPATIGSGYEGRHTVLPRTLREATEQMTSSSIPRELFGQAFVDHFARTRDWEWRQYCQAVTDWELRRYFEII